MAKIKLRKTITFNDAFESFILSKKSEGLANKTLTTYKGHLACIAHHINIYQQLSDISRSDFEIMISSMRESDLSSNSIASYVRTLKSFLSWARREGLSNVTLPSYKAEETIKETYTDRELELLLKKPNALLPHYLSCSVSPFPLLTDITCWDKTSALSSIV